MPPSTGMTAWWRADSISQEDGTIVSFLPDISGNNNNLIPVGAATGAIYYNNIINGYPALRFNGTSVNTMGSQTLNASDLNFTMVAIMSPQDLSTNHNIVDSSANGGRSVRTGTVSYQMVVRGLQAGPVATATTLVIGKPVAIFVGCDSLTVNYWTNNAVAGGGNINVSSTPGTYQIVGGGTSVMNAYLTEMMFYDHKITSSEKEQIASYIQNKYSINMGITNNFQGNFAQLL